MEMEVHSWVMRFAVSGRGMRIGDWTRRFRGPKSVVPISELAKILVKGGRGWTEDILEWFALGSPGAEFTYLSLYIIITMLEHMCVLIRAC